MKGTNHFYLILSSIIFIVLNGHFATAQNWQLVWQDEFTNSISSDWNFEVNGNGGGNNELQYYRAENASIQNGNLVITAKQENYLGKTYTSARMTTQGKKYWKYGKIEARIAVPSVQGIWPAFWMLGESIGALGWPKCGEIDIMEHVNTGNTNYGTIHWNSDANTHVDYGGNTQVNDITQYHTYSVEWDANAIRWYVDGTKYHEANIAGGVNSTSEFHENFFIILNLAVGGNWPGNNIGAMPTSMYVDYVRVYQDGVVVKQPSTGLVTVYKDCNYGGFSGGLSVGNYTLAQLNELGVVNDDISSLSITEGYKAILYQDDNFAGSSAEIISSNSCLNNTWNDKVSSIKVVPNGLTNMSGLYFLQNRNSGLYMDSWGANNNDGSNIAQGNFNGNTNQQFQFTHLGDGVYQVMLVHSNKALDIEGVKTTDGANVQQWTYYATGNQQFIVVPADNGFFKLVAKHSGKIVEVAGAGMQNGDNIQQWTNNNQTCGQWKFESVVTTGMLESKDEELILFPNPTVGILYIGDWKNVAETKIKIYNEQGQLVYQPNIALNSINIEALASGFYMIEIVNGDSRVIQPLVKK